MKLHPKDGYVIIETKPDRHGRFPIGSVVSDGGKEFAYGDIVAYRPVSLEDLGDGQFLLDENAIVGKLT